MRRMLCSVTVLLLLILAGPVLAESALRALPSFRSAYQARVGAIAAGVERPTFLGSASIAPRYGFPWMASIQIKGALRTVSHFCGGVVVAPRWILTAAHCVSVAQQSSGEAAAAVDPERLRVLTRSNVLFEGGDERSVAKVVLHDKYRIAEHGVPKNDLALLMVEGNPNFVPLQMPTERQAAEILAQGTKLRIFGWGTASFGSGSAISNNLLYAFVDVVDLERCNGPHIYAGEVDENMFCAGLGFADACQGDSGGPANGYLDGRMMLVGITSWGVGCTQENYPGVYANVAKYQDWIQRTIGAKR